MKKHSLSLVTIFSVLVLFFMAGCTQNVTDQRIENSVPTISVQGQGKVEAVPDEAIVRFGVASEEKSLAQAYQFNTNKMNKVISSVKETGIADKDIQTSSYNVRPIYPINERGHTIPGKPVSFRVSQQLTVTVRETAKVGGVIDKVIAGGVNTFDGIQFTSSKIEDLQKEAKVKAAKDAAEKAKLLAEGLGVKVGRVLRVNEQMIQPYRAEMRMMAFDSAGAKAAPQIEAGSMEVNAGCSVVYEAIN